MKLPPIDDALSELRPEDLWPAWQVVECLEGLGDMDSDEARRWKKGIYGLMTLWGLSPDEVIALAEEGEAEFRSPAVEKILTFPLLERLS